MVLIADPYYNQCSQTEIITYNLSDAVECIKASDKELVRRVLIVLPENDLITVDNIFSKLEAKLLI